MALVVVLPQSVARMTLMFAGSGVSMTDSVRHEDGDSPRSHKGHKGSKKRIEVEGGIGD
jgi:hypothetical protein